MKTFLIVAFTLLAVSLEAQVFERMWFSHKSSGLSFTPSWVDDNETFRCLIAYTNHTAPGAHFYNYPLLPDIQTRPVKVEAPVQRVSIASYSSEGNLTIAPLLSSNYESKIDWERPKIAVGNDVLYFIWHDPVDTLPSSFQFYGQDVTFKDQKDSTFHTQIIKTDLQLNILAAKRYQWHNKSHFSFSMEAVEVDVKNRLQLCFMRPRKTDRDDTIRIDSFSLLHKNSHYQRNLLRISPDLSIDTLVLFERFRTNDGSDKRIYVTSFSFGLNISQTTKKTHYLYEYQISSLNEDMSVNKIGTLETNLISTNPYNYLEDIDFAGKLWVCGAVPSNADTAILGGTSYPIDTNNPLSRILFTIDSTGNVEVVSKLYGNYTDALLSTTDEHMWLKLITNNTFTLDDSTFSSVILPYSGKSSRTHYIAYDRHGLKQQILEGPGGTWGNGHTAPIISGNLIYDNNGYNQAFLLDSTVFGKPGDVPVGVNFMHTQTRFYNLPKERPYFQIKQVSCNRVKVSHTRTDAAHYTLLVSTDSIRKWPRDGANYSFSYDYLKAFKLGKKTKVLHQGNDTSFWINNLVAGRRYFFAMIPGNGPAGNTVYNRDSIDTVSLYIPPSLWQDSLQTWPTKDTAICADDTLKILGTSPFPLTWMDRETEIVRRLDASANYYFTTTDSADCVLSSDSITLTVHDLPIISSIDFLTPPPYCEGDTVELEAHSNGSYLWEDGSTAPRFKVTSTGKYLLKSFSKEGCEASKEVAIILHPLPSFHFTVDSIVGYGSEVQVPYLTNADSLSWYYMDSAFTEAPTIAEGNYLLKVDAYSTQGCFVKDSIEIHNYDLQASIFPNAFSPNGDGVNDVWYFIHPDTSGVLTVFDRWGGIVFHGNNYWDGKKLGEVLPLGEYTYIVKTIQGKTEDIKSGIIQLIR